MQHDDRVIAAINSLEASTHAAIEETNELVGRVIRDQIEVRSTLAGLQAEVDALKARGTAWDNAHAGHSRVIVDGIAEAKRIANDTDARVEETLAAVDQRQSELAHGLGGVRTTVNAIQTEMHVWKEEAGAQVMAALSTHVAQIEKAADKVARSPAVKSAASVGGAVLGSAIVSALIEALKHL